MREKMDHYIACSQLFRRLIVAVSSSLIFSIGAQAANFTTLYQFTNGTDGEAPYGGVVQDAAGILYGTASSGGDSSCQSSCNYFGTVYSFSRTSGLKTMIHFTGPNGSGPANTLLLYDKMLYGNTDAGGASNDGVIFSVHTDGSGFALLHQFAGTDGMLPTGTPRLGTDGTLYGTAVLGGSYNQGVLFSIKPDGTYAILHEFTGGADGAQPTSLLISPAGTLVGSTFQGGADTTCGPPTGCGVIFSYRPSTGKYTVLHTFRGSSEPLLGSIGPGPTVYGTTVISAGNNVFALSPSGYQSIIKLFYYKEGSQDPGPTLALDGSLLLTNGFNNVGGGGNLLRIQNGKVTGDVTFNGSGGYGPSGQPIVSNTGTAIGTTYLGGLCDDCGTIYEVAP
jgi:uncharacterized repeat protein (TIGR03803 family)